jgi:hypothetical protein
VGSCGSSDHRTRDATSPSRNLLDTFGSLFFLDLVDPCRILVGSYGLCGFLWNFGTLLRGLWIPMFRSSSLDSFNPVGHWFTVHTTRLLIGVSFGFFFVGYFGYMCILGFLHWILSSLDFLDSYTEHHDLWILWTSLKYFGSVQLGNGWILWKFNPGQVGLFRVFGPVVSEVLFASSGFSSFGFS